MFSLYLVGFPRAGHVYGDTYVYDHVRSLGITLLASERDTIRFEFSVQSSVYSATTVVKVSLFSRTLHTVSFYSM